MGENIPLHGYPIVFLHLFLMNIWVFYHFLAIVHHAAINIYI